MATTPTPSPRRRDLQATSARSLLLTVLGEFVLPAGGSVWTWPLVTALGHLGVEEKAARQAIARTANEGLIVATREGRRTQHSLTKKGHRLLEEGAERIYGFLRESADWDDRWFVLTVSVPEAHRKLRHQMRTRLAWAGLGSPLPGVWVTPHVEKEKEVAAVVSELNIDAFSWVGPTASIGDVRSLVRRAWVLDDVARRYRSFLTAFSTASPKTADSKFVAQVRLVHAWRRFPFLDPALPPSLLPPKWPSAPAATMFHRQHERWSGSANSYWAELSREAESRT